MSIRRFALIGGVVMFVMGILALVPDLSRTAAYLPELQVTNSYGVFLGLFPMNIFNKLALIAFGIAGVMSARAESPLTAVKYSRTVALVMGTLAVFGFIPGLNTLYGYWPLFGGEILAHGAFAVLGAYFGYAVPARLERRTVATSL